MNLKRCLLSLFLLVITVFPTLPATAQDEPACSPEAGTVVRYQIQSAALGQDKYYNLYLPPNWCNLTDLPLVVLLHGMYGNYADWVGSGHIDRTADQLILAGQIQPVIILMPDGDNSFYVDGPDGDYETYIVDELVGAVDAAFPTAATRQTRFIGGLSMGGYGALYLGIRHTDMFSAVAANSPAVLQRNEAPPQMYGASGEYFDERDIITLIQRDGWPRNVRLLTDMGATDGLMPDFLRLLNTLLETQSFKFQIHIWPGAHTWSYWEQHGADYLRFFVPVED
jgi:S-formylglutathione hydrolase FrmB